jgi:hypothetical protein
VAQVAEEHDRLRDLVVSLEEQHGIHRIGQKRVVRVAENGFDVVQVFLFQARVDVLNRLGINVLGLNRAFVADPSRGQHGEES